MLKGFRDFILRGNVMDLAVAVIIGAAFTGIVTALTDKIINPLLGAFIGKPNFGYLIAHVNGGEFPHPGRRRLLLSRRPHAISGQEVQSHSQARSHQTLPTVPERHSPRRDPL